MKTNFTRRNFLGVLAKSAGMLAIPLPFHSKTYDDLFDLNHSYGPEADLSKNEKYWKEIRSMYSITEEFINLNNGGVSPQPKVVQEAVNYYNDFANKIPSYNLWRVMEKAKGPIKERLAGMLGCSKEEVAINRNATEGLETIIFGMELQEGDEIILSSYEYPSIKNAWLQREKRDKVVLKWVELDLPSEDTSHLIAQYKKYISPKTKVVQLTHMINWTGQIMPVKEIADAIHNENLEIIVDAAHSFAQIDFKINDWKISYLATSLHKWLCAPFGTGLLYVKKEKIKDVYPLFASPENHLEMIEKFEHLGTRSLALEQSINEAIEFHESIGIRKKRNRLFYLKNYLHKNLSVLEGLSFHTPVSKDYSGSILCFSIKGKIRSKLINELYEKYKIHVTGIGLNNMDAIRVSPNVYTLKSELDTFINAIKEIIS